MTTKYEYIMSKVDRIEADIALNSDEISQIYDILKSDFANNRTLHPSLVKQAERLYERNTYLRKMTKILLNELH